MKKALIELTACHGWGQPLLLVIGWSDNKAKEGEDEQSGKLHHCEKGDSQCTSTSCTLESAITVKSENSSNVSGVCRSNEAWNPRRGNR